MKKVDPEIIEKMAKQKNIDKDKIEKIADGYKGKSEQELMDELIKIGKTLEGKEEVVSKLKAFLNEEQRQKIDTVMNKITQAEAKTKIDSKKQKKSSSQSPTSSDTPKKTKKVIKKVKKSSGDK